MVNNPVLETYKRKSVTTLTPVEIVIKLYDECEKQLNRGIHFIGQKDYANTNKALIKAYELVRALQSVLDMSIPMSKDLDNLYNYFCTEILKGNLKKDTAVIEAILPLIAELKDAFTQIAKMPKGPAMAQHFNQGLLSS